MNPKQRAIATPDRDFVPTAYAAELSPAESDINLHWTIMANSEARAVDDIMSPRYRGHGRSIDVDGYVDGIAYGVTITLCFDERECLSYVNAPLQWAIDAFADSGETAIAWPAGTAPRAMDWCDPVAVYGWLHLHTEVVRVSGPVHVVDPWTGHTATPVS